MAGNRKPIDEILSYQNAKLREVLRETGLPTEQIEAQTQHVAELVEAAGQLRRGEYEGPDMFGGAHLDFWRASFRLSDELDQLIENEKRPFLIVLGGYDWNVQPAHAVPAWEASLKKSPAGVDHTVAVLEGIAHPLNRISQPDWTKLRPADVGEHVDEAVIDAMLEYLGSRH